MGFLNDLAANKVTQETTMPTWYDQAQQNVVNKAAAGAGAVPTLANTVAGGAINQLSGAQNPFTQAQGTLNQIATGAANPWITGANGQVTPNTNTALGGLFQAQNQQLNQLLPNVTAPVEGANIASGNFGSLRGQTAVDKAKADAFAQLITAQNQAALQNQQTGVQAATGLGNVGSQGVTSMTQLGQAQQADPLLAATGLGKIVAGINTPTTVTSQTQLSPLNLAGTLVSALGGSVAGANKLLESMNIAGGLGGLAKSVGSLFSSGEPKTYPMSDGGNVMLYPDGSKVVTNGKGQTSVFDKNGNPLGNTFPAGAATPKPGGGTGAGGAKVSPGIPTDAVGTLPTGAPDPYGAPTGRYDLGGGRYMINNPDGSKTIYEANGTSQSFDPEGNLQQDGVPKVNYDENGQMVSSTVTNPDGSTTTYDNAGHVISETPAGGGESESGGGLPGGGQVAEGGGESESGGGLNSLDNTQVADNTPIEDYPTYEPEPDYGGYQVAELEPDYGYSDEGYA